MLNNYKNIYDIKFSSIFIGIGLFFLSIKGSDAVQIEAWLLEISLPEFFVKIKESGIILAIVTFFSVFVAKIFDVKSNTYSFKGVELSLVFFGVIILFVIRGVVESGDNDRIRWISAFLFNILCFSVALLIMSDKSIYNAWLDLKNILRTWAVIFVFVNIALYFGGYGFTDDGVRFYGCSGHPNFLGVCLAICFLTFFLDEYEEYYLKVIRVVFLLSIAFLLFLSGSRTSWLMVLSGVLYYLSIEGYIKLPAMVFIAISSIFLLIYGGDIYNIVTGAADSYEERLLENTRSEAWDVLFTDWLKNPIFGVGVFSWASENSLLKSLAFGGALLGVPMLYLYIFLIYQIVRYVKFCRYSKSINLDNYSYGITILISIYVGSFFEGYLLELSGVWVVVTYVILIILGRTDREIYSNSLSE